MVLFLALLTLALPAWAGLTKNVEYGRAGDVRLLMDVSIPDGDGPFMAAILVHGGSWSAGDKSTYVKPLFQPLSDAGIAWFSINYRLAPQYKYPAALDDVETAVEYVRAHAGEYHINPKKIALIGESAGGHLVALAGARSKHVAAVVSFYGPHDLVKKPKETGKIGAAVQAFLDVTEAVNDESLRKLREASPITYVSRQMPPFLLIHGTADTLVDYQQSVRMCNAMKKAGARCEVFTVEGAPHGVLGWEKNEQWLPYKAKMVAWLKEYNDKP